MTFWMRRLESGEVEETGPRAIDVFFLVRRASFYMSSERVMGARYISKAQECFI
jgi:hypothetical protein